MKKLLIVLGKPGSGKDTQIEMLKKLRPIHEISVGDLVRSYAKSHGDIKNDMNSGKLVDNRVVNSLFFNAVTELDDNLLILCNGYPRDFEQADWLEKELGNMSLEIDKVLLIDISDEEVIKRLSKRGRDDDTSNSVQKRLSVFHNNTQRVIDHFKQKGLLVVADGMGTEKEVEDSIIEALGW